MSALRWEALRMMYGNAFPTALPITPKQFLGAFFSAGDTFCLRVFADRKDQPFSGMKLSTKTVRVGWYESPFNMTDQFGRRSGYAYDYQQKIAAYTGWNYEYVEGSWPDLLQMLMDGEIDSA